MGEINTHGLIIEYGKHKFKLFTRLPRSYLTWMVNEQAPQYEVAMAELDRRGTALPEVELSGHAIDSASLRCRKIWHENKAENQGLYSWLQQVTLEAIKDGERLESGKIKYLGMKFVVHEGEEFPVLKTIMRVRRK